MIITISGSPIELVKEMSLKHGFDDYIGSSYVLNDKNIFTGEILPMWDSVNKNNAIENFVKKYDIDLSKSYAYGDTSGDYSMLKSIEYPTAINPTKELLAKIVEDNNLNEKINIVVERKDVVYTLDSKCINFYNKNL
jgi:phosphoserine phosphatase